MTRRLLLNNIYIPEVEGRDSIQICNSKYNVKYTIFQEKEISLNQSKRHKNQQNAYIEFKGEQLDSILFPEGKTGSKLNPRKRKLIEDILILGSILTGYNWCLDSNRKKQLYPLYPRPYLECIAESKNDIEKLMNNTLNRILDKDWQKKFENGYHLVMLYHRANIYHDEARFLSNIVIWEWLNIHLGENEGDHFKQAFNNLLEENFKIKVNDNDYPNADIFRIVRNQLAHSGKLPIAKKRAKNLLWTTKLEWKDLKPYLEFFDRLTQTIVLKTLDITPKQFEESGKRLNQILKNGKL